MNRKNKYKASQRLTVSQKTVSRRTFLGSAAAGAMIGTLAPQSLLSSARARTPALALHAKPSMASLLGQGLPQTKIWGFGGQVPGPIIRVKQGGEVAVQLHNQLEQATTVHWHGIRIDNKMDGVANLTQKAVPPGKSFDYRFTVPDAGTFWYHPHNRSWDQMARGLYGLLIVEEKNPPQVDQDLAFVIDDWVLRPDGALDVESMGNIGEWAHGGRTGNVLTVNGRPEQVIAAKSGERLRLRLVNTANARILQLRLQGKEAKVIAVDGQPILAPRALKDGALTLPPAGRADVMLDMTGAPGSQCVIAEVSDLRVPLIRVQTHNSDIKRKNPLRAPISLPANPIAEPDLKNALAFKLDMQGGAMGGMRKATHKGRMMDIGELVDQHKMIWAFNGIAGMDDKPFFSVRKGQTVIIRFLNNTSWPHAMHLHGHHMRAIKHLRVTRRGKRELQVEKDWRDSALIERGEELQVAFVADNPGKWMLHCHMLEHQAGGMMTWFEVVA